MDFAKHTFTHDREVHSISLPDECGVRTYVDFSMRMPRSEPARHAGAGRRPRPQAAPPTALTASTHAAILGRETTDVVVSPIGWHLNSVRIRDVRYFIGPTASSSPGPPIHAAHVFLLSRVAAVRPAGDNLVASAGLSSQPPPARYCIRHRHCDSPLPVPTAVVAVLAGR